MKINKLNYENYVIDYIEGTLSNGLKKDFDLFLEKNEEVYEEIKDYISAPVLEESTEIFTDKKSIQQKKGFNPNALLAIIPLLLIGSYFISQNISKEETKEVKVNTQNIIQQFAQEDKQETKSILPSSAPTVEEKIESEIPKKRKTNTVQPQTKKATVQQPNNGKVFFASNDIIKAEPAPINKFINHNTVTEIDVQALPMTSLNQIASLDIIPMETLSSNIDPRVMNVGMASATEREGSLLDQLQERSGWLEMVTPAAFEDIDLRESLAIESNVNINTSRKILNAFIPESLVK